MYQLTDLTTGEIFIKDEPRYVRKDERGIWMQCTEEVAQCVVIAGKRFSIFGKDPVDDAPEILKIAPLDVNNFLTRINRAGVSNTNNIDEIQAAFLNLCDTVLDWYTELKSKEV